MKKIFLITVVLTSILTSIWLWGKTYFINPWPTDSWCIYIPSAKLLPKLNFISELHILNQNVSAHNKEILILVTAIFQKIFNDSATIFPNIAPLIICFFLSSIFLYLILTKWFDPKTGLLGFFLFITSFWSYLYIFQGAHQPLVFANLLCAVYLLTVTKTRCIQYFLSGIFLGLMLYSSPTAPLFLVYYLAAFMYIFFIKNRTISFIKLSVAAGFIILGLVLVVIPLTAPDPLDTIKRYFDFVEHTRHNNDFSSPHIFFSHDFIRYSKRGAGIVWIFEYFFLTMPVYFTFYLFSLLLLLKHIKRIPALSLIILLSLSTPICVEISQSAQFGRNYYSWHLGMILAICTAFFLLKQSYTYRSSVKNFQALSLFFLIFLISNAYFNMKTLLYDVIPSRLFTNTIYSWLKQHQQTPVYLYKYNRYNTYAGQNIINNPKYTSKINFKEIISIKDAKNGFILIPPISGNNIYSNCQGVDFNSDPYLTELLNSGRFQYFVAAQFPTIGSSDIWNQEEEYCTYVDLHLRKISAQDKFKSHAFLLDADKLQKDWFGKGFGDYQINFIFQNTN